MMIPGSLQMIGLRVFAKCSKFVLFNFVVSYNDHDTTSTTSDVVAYLQTQQRIASLEKMVAALTTENAAQATDIASLTTENAAQATEIAALGTRIAQLEIALPTPPPNTLSDMIGKSS
ncbi:hypothetical protein TL16_g10679 [Triparma laevis f. inornata]|uniref:Uncharacterized protein n=2 Tax=Triparma laevis TaxID=1534972 RepID=A0A9W7KZL9_9STRA|nr:hypothetical protein TL16_g10679 [Triparma laevis f. inornata]GMI16896.1 hypothetical protein TrLO_g12203 [Triparma laevis f. longispina]